jgi:hypothetical protein
VTTAEKYVTAAYLVVLAIVLLYVVVYAFKLARLEREVSRLARLAAERRIPGEAPKVKPAEPVRTVN